MVYLLPIEPYKERYSSWWFDHIPLKFKQRNIECIVIEGKQLTDKVETGTVLDAGGTNYYKATQLQEISSLFQAGKIKPYDSFLICDLWFPGIEMLPYMAELYNTPINIWGVWHAGSITNYDFVEPMNQWAQYFEMGWINMCSGVFVGSDYSKNSLISRLGAKIFVGTEEEGKKLLDKIHPYGMPLNWDDIHTVREININQSLENIIVFPHRPDFEKNPTLFFDVIETLSYVWDDFENWKFVFCTSKEKYQSKSLITNARLSFLSKNFLNVEIQENLSREDYYNLLDKSKIVVSTTREENFGYCAVEAAAFACSVVCPKDFSHIEIFSNDMKKTGDDRILYEKDDDIPHKIMLLADNPVPGPEMTDYVKNYQHTVDCWIDFIIGRRR